MGWVVSRVFLKPSTLNPKPEGLGFMWGSLHRGRHRCQETLSRRIIWVDLALGFPGAAQLICRSWRSSDDRGDFHEKDYSLQLRGDLSVNAASSYADLLMLPLACVAMVALWRWTPIQTKGLRWALQEETWSERLSAVRNWAGWNGFSAIVDLPSVAMGLASVVVPTRLPAFLSVLITRDGFQNREDDCEARGYLLVLPFLAVADVIAGCLAFVGLINPLRSARTLRLLSSCWRDEGEDGALGLSRQFQKAVCWNAELRRRAVLIGLCSLMDVLVLPLSLVVCATLYRASPLLAQLWPSAAQDHEGWAPTRAQP